MASSTRFSSAARGLAVGLLLGAWVAPAAVDASKEARARVAASQQLYNLGKFPEALAELEAAYKLKPAPGLLFNIAQCHRQMRNFERAAFFFRAYVDSGATGEQVVVAKGLAGEMEAAEAKRKAEAEAAEQERLAAERQAAEKAKADEATREKERALELEIARLAAQKAQPAAPPVYTRWWFWTAIGVVAVGTTVAIAASAPQPRAPSLGQVNLR